MTSSQATRLIEQFSSQCPLAIWILDSRGVAVFANDKLHEIFKIPRSPSGAVGIHVLEMSSIRKLHLEKQIDRLMDGESISTTVHIEHPNESEDGIKIKRTEPLTLRIVAYVLKSSTQAIEHFVVFLEDVTSTRAQHESLREQTQDIKTFLLSKKARHERLEELKTRAEELRERIRKLGQEPQF